MTRYSLDCPSALVVFKITHEDRAGTTSSVIRKEGEVVTMDHGGQAIIATEEGDIILCPVTALHAVTKDMQVEHDLVAAVELVRWIPADTVPFTLEWKSPEGIKAMLNERG